MLISQTHVDISEISLISHRYFRYMLISWVFDDIPDFGCYLGSRFFFTPISTLLSTTHHREIKGRDQTTPPRTASPPSICTPTPSLQSHPFRNVSCSSECACANLEHIKIDLVLEIETLYTYTFIKSYNLGVWLHRYDSPGIPNLPRGRNCYATRNSNAWPKNPDECACRQNACVYK